MITYSIKITGDLRLREKLALLAPVMVSTLQAWAVQTAAYCVASKLSGDPLNRRSGRLSRTVHGESEHNGDMVSGVVAAGRDVPYARIHEFGGVIKAHQVVARNAAALSFTASWGPMQGPGGKAFRKRVNIPEIHMPERSYMRSSLRERAPDGIAQLKAATMGILS
ncbi:MAG: hypothetical protein ACHQ7M_05290 [Chloroflexota bacterium]